MMKRFVPLLAVAVFATGCVGTYTIRTQDVKDVFSGNTVVAALDVQNTTDCRVLLRSYPFAQVLEPGAVATITYNMPIPTGRSHRREVTATPVECSVEQGTKRTWSFSESRNRGTNVRSWLIEKSGSRLRFR